MLLGTPWTTKTRLHSLSLTVNEFSREWRNWEGTKEETRNWIRLGDLDEILEHPSLFPSWRNFSTEWRSLQLSKSVWIFSVELYRQQEELSRRTHETDLRKRRAVVELQRHYFQDHKWTWKKVPSHFRFNLLLCSRVLFIYLAVFLPHVRDVNVSLSEEPITLPTRPARISHFFRLCFLYGRRRFLLQLLCSVGRFCILLVVTGWVLSCGFSTERQIYPQVWWPLNTFQSSMHRLQ